MTSGPASGAFGTLAEARAVLHARFGYPDFRRPQLPAVEAVLSGRDALIVLPTGGGKSLCYQVPALVRRGLTLVISPLISLMKDQVEALTRRGIGAAFINSTLTGAEVSERLNGARLGQLRLLYLSPERLMAGQLADRLATIGVALLAVDEAHCISEWGHDFRPAYRQIGAARVRLGRPQTVALTATATPQVRRDITGQLSLQHPAVVVGGFDRTNLTYHVVRTPARIDKDRAAVTWLRNADGPSIVYAPTRTMVEQVTATLVRARVRATAYHAGLHDTLRQRAQDAFMGERVRVIVATSAFGMGIDKPDVRLVVHHAMPGTPEAYYQEAGRAGRDGLASVCVLLYAPADRATHEFFIAAANPSRPVVEATWLALRNAADSTGFVAASPASLVHRVPTRIEGTRVDERVIAAAIRVLQAAGACHVVKPAAGRGLLRLLATPARIARELTGDRHADRAALRALWRVVGESLTQGAVIDLEDGLPGLGGAKGLVPVLERLEAQQFVMWTPLGSGIQLDPRHQNPAWLPVSWHALAMRRDGDRRRLDAMQQYSETRHCRRAYVLRYFGDPAARAFCGACDRCLARAVVPPARRHS